MKSTVVAIGSLFLAVALTPVVGAALFVLLLLGQFLLALVAVIGGRSDRTVQAARALDEHARLARIGRSSGS